MTIAKAGTASGTDGKMHTETHKARRRKSTVNITTSTSTARCCNEWINTKAVHSYKRFQRTEFRRWKSRCRRFRKRCVSTLERSRGRLQSSMAGIEIDGAEDLGATTTIPTGTTSREGEAKLRWNRTC
ncbi:MAG: hypothetical protein ACLR8P_16550 [Clostridium fessum]